jgi:hypothetical protein
MILLNEISLSYNQNLFTVVAIGMTALMAGHIAQVYIPDSLAKRQIPQFLKH